jgi:hypothetical protein
MSTHHRSLSEASALSQLSFQTKNHHHHHHHHYDYDGLTLSNHLNLPVKIASQIPVWDSHRNSLMMTFLRNRIRESSNKNFVFYRSEQVRGGSSSSSSSSSNNKWRVGSQVSTQNALLQFGKYENNVYSLDFRKPVAPLHAFAIALSTFPAKWHAATKQ